MRNHTIHFGKLIPLVLIFGLVRNTSAQEEIFSLGMQLGTGARAIAMGGAYTALGADYSASFWNPAALADIRRIEFYGSLNMSVRQSTAEFDNIPFIQIVNENNETFTNINEVGIAYPVPTQRGSLVLSFGYNRVKSFDSNFDFRAFNFSAGDSVNQAWREFENGSLNNWTLAGAVDVSPNMSVGIGLNFWTGGSEFHRTFREVDIDDIYTFENFTVDDNLNTDITGFNLKLGTLIDLSPLSIGAAITTPVTLKVKENFSTLEEELDDNLEVTDEFFDEGFFEYKIRSPWAFNVGASLNLLNFVVSGDLEFNDWSNIEYKSAPPFNDLTQAEANRIIRDSYGQETEVDLDFVNFTVPEPRIRLGAEFTLPLTGLSFRAGYFRDPSVFKDAFDEEDKQFFSAGLGFLVDRQVRLDLAFVHGFWKSFNQGLTGTDDIGDYFEDIKVNRAFISLAYRL